MRSCGYLFEIIMALITKSFEIPENKLSEVLMPMLEERVFHVTSHAAAEKILSGEGILTNEDGNLPSGCGSSLKGFFRLRGCISLFDFRGLTDEGREKAISWAGALNPRGNAKYCPTFLLVNPSLYGQLIPWTVWNEEKKGDEMIVPHAECGHKGSIPLDMITEAWFVTVVRDKNSFGYLLEQAITKKLEGS